MIPQNIDERVLLGILNSHLLSYLYIRQVSQAVKDDFPQVTIKDVLSLPFPSIESIKSKESQIISLVDRMLELHKQSAAARSPQDKERMKREIESTDGAIDRLVYELYGLTEDEVKIVEGQQ